MLERLQYCRNGGDTEGHEDTDCNVAACLIPGAVGL